MELQADFTACAPGKAHNWIIETPNGVMAHAYCKHCHQEREFPNAGRDLPMPLGRQRTRKELAAEEVAP